MEATENKIEATYQEAWIDRLLISVEFYFNDNKFKAKGVYYNNYGIEDIEVFSLDSHGRTYFEEGDAEYEAGKNLLEDMNLDNHLTF